MRSVPHRSNRSIQTQSRTTTCLAESDDLRSSSLILQGDDSLMIPTKLSYTAAGDDRS
jgi:hypothetical protein